MPLTWEDKLNLQDLMVRYAAALDIDGTEDEFLGLFTLDAVLDSPMTGHNVGRDGLKNFWANTLKLRDEMMIRHYITNYRVDGEGDRATIKAYFIEMITYRKPRMAHLSRVTEFLFSGLYDCVAIRDAGKWRLQRRTVFVDAHSPLD